MLKMTQKSGGRRKIFDFLIVKVNDKKNYNKLSSKFHTINCLSSMST